MILPASIQDKKQDEPECLAAIAVPAMPSETLSYTYDARGRLVKVVRSGTINNGVTADYSYDNADNRSNVSVTTGGPPLPAFSVNDVAVAEGGTIAFSVSKSGSTTDTLSVDVATVDASAHAGTDYTSTSTTLTFLPGDATKTVNVPTTNNGIVDGTRTFYLNLSNASAGSAISDSQGVGTINDDEVAVIPSFAVSDVSANEGSSITFTVTKTGLTNLSYSINYATANGTATAGSDYTSKTGTLTFAATDTQKTVTVSTTSDTTPENNETFLFNLSGATGGATIGDAQAVGTIVNDDGVGVTVSDGAGTEGDLITLYVTKVGSTSSTITVNWATADGSAVAPSDYVAGSGVLTFAPADTSKTINIQTNQQRIVEGDEIFLVNLTKGTGTYTLMRNQAGITIADWTQSCNDPVPSCLVTGDPDQIE